MYWRDDGLGGHIVFCVDCEESVEDFNDFNVMCGREESRRDEMPSGD